MAKKYIAFGESYTEDGLRGLACHLADLAVKKERTRWNEVIKILRRKGYSDIAIGHMEYCKNLEDLEGLVNDPLYGEIPVDLEWANGFAEDCSRVGERYD